MSSRTLAGVYSKKILVMKKNMGATDRSVRIILAVLFSILYYTKTVTGNWGIVLLALAGVFLLTSVVSFCPLYLPFGFNTSKKA
ncbi:MAG: hypothetical protein RL213_1801 [Bacteroidota bacterium]|jgi:membrane protein YdbS with pleckstrin-like domain